MSKSLFNRIKGKAAIGLALAVAASITLFVVCGSDDTPDTGGNVPPPPPGKCDADPTAQGCSKDPCVINSSSAACCATAWKDPAKCQGNPCDANPAGQGCPNDPCRTSATSAACCATSWGNIPANCQTSGDKYCMWDNDPDNCYIIGDPVYGSPETQTEATCRAASGMVVTKCEAQTGLQYCHWGDPGGCHLMSDPNGPNPENPSMTNLQACRQFGWGVSSRSDCSDISQPTTAYCNWDWGECHPIKPNDPNPENAGMTNYEACAAYGKGGNPGGIVSTCTPPPPPPATRYYCDYSSATNPTNCWELANPGAPASCPEDPTSCAGRTALEHCEVGQTQGWAKVVTCPPGATHPGQGQCCQ